MTSQIPAHTNATTAPDTSLAAHANQVQGNASTAGYTVITPDAHTFPNPSAPANMDLPGGVYHPQTIASSATSPEPSSALLATNCPLSLSLDAALSNDEAFARANHSIPGGVNSPVRAFGSVGGTPRFIAAAHGPYIQDIAGKTYVDLVCSWGPALLGHAFPEVVQAVREAAGKGLSFGAPCLAEVELAELICARIPAIDQVRLVSTGTEATMTALRLARGITGRDLIVKFAGCYHGHSDGLLAAAGSGLATAGLPGSAGVSAAVVGQTLVLPYNDVSALQQCFDQYGPQIAAVITEAAPANMGVVAPAAGFNQTIRCLTAQHGSLMILDEVLTGFRVGPAGWWGQEVGICCLPDPALDGALRGHTPAGPQRPDGYYEPDIFTFGKVVGGGMPLAALAGKSRVMEQLAPLGPVYQAGTLSGNPLACVAGAQTLRLAGLANYQRIDTVSQVLRQAVSAELAAVDVPHFIGQAANLFNVFFGSGPAQTGVSNYPQAQSQNEDMFKSFFHSLLDQGVNLPPSGYEAWFISSAHDDRAVAQILDALPQAALAAKQSE